MNILTSRTRRQGVTLLAFLFLMLLLIVFIGSTAYVILKAIKRLPVRPPPAEEAALVQSATESVLQSMRAAHPGESVSVGSSSTFYVPGFDPFGTLSVNDVENPGLDSTYVIVERSTNLVNWETVARLVAGESYVDTNMPPVCAFYRSHTTNGVTAQFDTNHVTGFYHVPVKSP